MNQPQIIGIGGTNASGKDTLAHYLAETYGYLFISTGDMVREVAMQREGNILRPTLQIVANDLRAERGAGVLVELAIEHFKASNNKVGLIAASIRTQGEIAAIKQANGMLLYIDADQKLRYQRITERQRADDRISFEDFIAQEQAEWHQSDDPAEFSVRSVKEAADYCFTNTEDMQAFFDKVAIQLGLSKK